MKITIKKFELLTKYSLNKKECRKFTNVTLSLETRAPGEASFVGLKAGESRLVTKALCNLDNSEAMAYKTVEAMADGH